MKIIKKSSFTYPLNETYKGELVFKPLIDYKFRILLSDGNCIEAGVFKLLVDGKMEMHACVSTQAGCKFGCIMCKSGEKGFVRNLSTEEILKQIKLISNSSQVKFFDHVVFMGIGEPLDNYSNFISSVIDLIKTNNSYSGRLSLATVGLPDKLRLLLEEPIPNFKMLWISLHAPTDEKRARLIPISKIYSIGEIINTAQYFACHTKTEVWINYMLFRGFNDGYEDAHSLAAILKNTESIFSLMITEPNNDLPNYRRGNYLDLSKFEKYLLSLGVKNRIAKFIAAGKKVNAGCGEFIFKPY